MKLYRALLRVIKIEDTSFWATIPSRNPYVAISIPFNILPFNIIPLLKENKRLHVYCNLDDPTSLIFKDWEEN